MKKPNEWLKDEYFKGGDWRPFDMDEAMQKYAEYYASQLDDTITPQMTITEQQDTIGQLKTQIDSLLSEVKRLTVEQPQTEQDEDNALDEWWRELTKRQIDFILLKIG